MDVSRLTEEASGDSPGADAAAADLIAGGAAVVPRVIEAIREGSGAVWRLQEVLLSLRDPDLAPHLIRYLGEKNTDVAMTVFEALGGTRDSRALEPLLGALSGSRRGLAIVALGDLGDRGALTKLLDIIDHITARPETSAILNGTPPIPDENVDEEPLRLLPKVIVALAKLGHFERASLLAPLSRYRSRGPYSEAELIRIEVVEAMQHVAFPGMFQNLTASLEDESAEVRLNAVEAVFYLGARESVETLISRLGDQSSTVASHILYRLHSLTSTRFEELASDAWWRQHRDEYRARVCHRLGQPIDLSKIISLLEDSSDRRSILQELRIITNQDFGFNLAAQSPPPDHVVERARQWWQDEGKRFEIGRLYKHGYPQDLETVLRKGPA